MARHLPQAAHPAGQAETRSLDAALGAAAAETRRRHLRRRESWHDVFCQARGQRLAFLPRLCVWENGMSMLPSNAWLVRKQV